MQALARGLKALRLGDLAVRRNPVYYAEARKEIEKLCFADLGTRRAWTRGRLATALAAAQRAPYGRRAGGSLALASWPLLEKAEVRADPGAFLASRWLVVRASTGGTSGAPLALARSLRSVVLEQACLDRMMELLGADPREARIAVLRGDEVKDPADLRPPYWRFDAGGRRLVMSSSHLGPSTAGDYASALEDFAPEVLWAHPSSLESLCLSLRRAGRVLRLPRVLASSEVLHAEVWSLAERTLGCELLDYYGQAERVAFAYARSPGAYRFLPGYACVELLPVEADGADVLYEIVGTSLWNGAMPLVRYRTGDLVRLPAAWGAVELEEVALGLRAFGGVLGRDGDILVSPEGVRVNCISHFQRDVANLVRIQVIQESAADVRILAQVTDAFGPADEAKLLANARKRLPGSMRVRVERAEALERTSRGKTPFVIHRPAVKAMLEPAAA